MNKLRTLYEHSQNENSKFQKTISNLQQFRNKFFEQHCIINSCVKKWKNINDDMNVLKEKNIVLQNKLDKNKQEQKKLKSANVKLKMNNEKFMKFKKEKEISIFNSNDNLKKRTL